MQIQLLDYQHVFLKHPVECYTCFKYRRTFTGVAEIVGRCRPGVLKEGRLTESNLTS